MNFSINSSMYGDGEYVCGGSKRETKVKQEGNKSNT